MRDAWRRLWRALSVGALAVSAVAAGSLAFVGSAVVAPGVASAQPPTCTDQWKTATNGNWDTPTNWSTGVVPGPSDVACIIVPGTYTVTYQPSSSTETVDSLVLGSGTVGDQETLNVQGTCSDNVTLVTKNTANGTDTDLINSTGHLSLTSTSCGNASTVAIGSTLVNQGTISSDPGAGNGGRTITGSVTNDGTVNVNASASFSGGTWDNAGPLNVATGETFTVSTSPSTFTDDTGGSVVMTGTGGFTVDSGDTYNQGNGTTSGNAVLLAGPSTGGITLHYTGTGASTVVAEGGTGTLDGAIVAGQVLSIDGTCANNAVETVDQNETNAGTVHLSSTGCGNAATLAVGSGHTFTNQSAGIVDVDAGVGNGGRAITGNFTNDGSVNVNASGSYAGGTWDNAGTLNIADAETWTVSTSPSTFTDDTGGSVVSNGTAQTGQLVVDSGDTYNQGNGTTSGEPVLLAGPSTGGITLHYTGTGASTVVAEGGTGTLDGAIVAGQVLSIDGTCANNAVETVDQNETNAGTVHLSSTGCGNAATLAVGSGHTFTNQSAGIVDVDAGVGNGGRAITGNFTNDGHVNVNVAASYSGGTWTNSGTVAIATSTTLTAPVSGGVTFTNTTGGSVAASGSGLLQLDGANTFNQGAGTTSGTEPVLLLGPSSGTTGGVALHYTGTGASTITTEGLGSLDGTMSTGQILDVFGTCSNNANEVIDKPMTTTGTIDLSSISCGNASALAGKKASGKDKLTVGKHGVLQTDSGAGNGGRTIHDDVVLHKGTLNVNVNTTYTADKHGLTNTKGTVNLAASTTLTESAVTGSVFSNAKGAIAGSGELLVDAPDTFDEGAGTITGVTVLVDGANLEYAATATPGAGSIEAEGNTTLSGTPSAGQTLVVDGTCSLNGNLSTTGSVSVAGSVVLSSTSCGNNSSFVLPAGDTLTVAPGGSLSWPSGAGGTKTVTGNLIDNGTIGNSGENGLNVTGTVAIGAGGTYAPSVSTGSSDSVTATGGGTLNGTLAPSGTFTANQNYTIFNGAFTGSFSTLNGWVVTNNPTTVTMKHS